MRNKQGWGIHFPVSEKSWHNNMKLSKPPHPLIEPEGKKKTTIMLASETHTELKAEATRSKRNVSAQIELYVEEGLSRRQLP